MQTERRDLGPCKKAKENWKAGPCFMGMNEPRRTNRERERERCTKPKFITKQRMEGSQERLQE
jgi:hypothetical protein